LKNLLFIALILTLTSTLPILTGCDTHKSGSGASGNRKLTIAVMPKAVGNAYFISCREGADEAARELGVDLLWDGPTASEPGKQNQVVDTWITRGVDVIAVSVNDAKAISTALRRARSKGIKVITWDADAEPDARDFFINQATPEGIAAALVSNAAAAMGGQGEFALIMGQRDAANMKQWWDQIKLLLATPQYQALKCVTDEACNDDMTKAQNQTAAILNAYPNVKLILAICSPGVPGAAEAVTQAGRKDVKVVGLGLPNQNKRYVRSGVTEAVILWNTRDLGYLTVQAAKLLAEGKLKSGDTSVTAGRLGKLEIHGDNVLLGTPFRFDKTNIDQFDF
jgi:rhamnose transport system substrate-binding protein